jgi:hypothetical protein
MGMPTRIRKSSRGISLLLTGIGTKDSLRLDDYSDFNRFVPEEDRPVPFGHRAYVGDDETDIPCFRVVKDREGHSIVLHYLGKYALIPSICVKFYLKFFN